MSDVSFSPKAWKEYIYWQTQDKRTLKKINSLIQEIQRLGPLEGTGKAELLKYHDEPTYSRRINNEDRLTYLYDEKTKAVFILSCAGHYE